MQNIIIRSIYTNIIALAIIQYFRPIMKSDFLIYLLISNIILKTNASCNSDLCLQCRSDLCIKCVENYIVKDNQCIKGICNYEGCNSCDITNLKCLKCKNGYMLNFNRHICVKIGQIIFFVIIILAIVFFYITCKLRFRYQEGRIHQFINSHMITRNLIKKTKKDIIIHSEFIFLYDSHRDNCSICLEYNCDVVTKCSHYFHLQCLYSWINKTGTCPCCKNDRIFSLLVIICELCKQNYKQFQIQQKDLINKVKQLKQTNCSICSRQSCKSVNKLVFTE